MARYSLVNAGQIGTTGIYTEVKDYSSQEHVNPVTGFARRRINFSKFLTAAGLANFAAGDYIALFPVKKGQLLWAAAWAALVQDTKTDTGTGTHVNVTIGDETAPDTSTAPTTAATSLFTSFDISTTNATKMAATNTQKLFLNDGAIFLQVLGDGGAPGTEKRPKDAVLEVAVAIADIFPFLRNSQAAAGLTSLI